MKTAHLLLALCVIASPLASAGEPVVKPVEWQFGIGLAHGGDDLARIEFTDGDSQTLRAGSGVQYYFGIFNEFDNQPLALQATVGYLSESTAASNSNARFSRYPLDVMLLYGNGKHRFGGGLTYHMSPSLDLDNLGGTYKADNAAGFLLEYGYGIFALRYTSIDYDFAGASIDGGGIGLHLVYNY